MSDVTCEHKELDLNADIQRDGENHRWLTRATVKCRDCGAPFYWGCDGLGLLESEELVDGFTPSVNLDASELRIFLSPVKPQLVTYLVRWRPRCAETDQLT
jgi:hypothetical protein